MAQRREAASASRDKEQLMAGLEELRRVARRGPLSTDEIIGYLNPEPERTASFEAIAAADRRLVSAVTYQKADQVPREEARPGCSV